MSRQALIVVPLILLLASGCPGSESDPRNELVGPGPDVSGNPDGGLTVPKFGTVEIQVLSSRSFSGSPTPRLETRLTAVRPSGDSVRVPLFYSGDGQGSLRGNVFEARILADETGEWTWFVEGSMLQRASGSFVVEGPLVGAFGGGPVRICEDEPRYFCLGDRGPVYLLAKFLDEAADDDDGFPWSHTLWSEQHSPEAREAFFRRQQELAVNRIDIYVANRGDYDATPTTPWVGRSGRIDHSTFDLARWELFDSWIRRLRDEGIVAHVWLFADDSGYGSLPLEDRVALAGYAASRLSAFANVMFCLVLEWQEGWDEGELEAVAAAVRAADPWDRPVSVHGVPGPFAFPDGAWNDHMVIQPGNDAGPAEVFAAGVEARELALKPVLNEEFGLGHRDARHRRNLWAALIAGAAGSGTGAFLPEFRSFVDAFPFWEVHPDEAGRLAGDGFAAADEAGDLVLILTLGADVAWSPGTDVSAGAFQLLWYDPRTGGTRTGSPATEGGRVLLVPPTRDDWVAVLARDGGRLQELREGLTRGPS